MVPCARIHYLDSDPGALPKCFKEGLSWRRSAFGLDFFNEMESLSLYLKNEIWNFIHLKVHRTKRDFWGPYTSLCLALNRLVIHPITISNQKGVLKWTPVLDWTNCQAIVLLLPQSHRVRHRFVNQVFWLHGELPWKTLAHV